MPMERMIVPVLEVLDHGGEGLNSDCHKRRPQKGIGVLKRVC